MTDNALLEPKLIGDIKGRFYIPAYQRGYRWESEHILMLLNDIWENGDANYCLQPIVVKKMEEGTFELIDGQQDECDMMIDNFSPSVNDSPTKIGAGNATNQQYASSSGLDQPVYLGKGMFIHTHESNVAHLGKALLSPEEIEKLNYDPMNRVPRT